MDNITVDAAPTALHLLKMHVELCGLLAGETEGMIEMVQSAGHGVPAAMLSALTKRAKMLRDHEEDAVIRAAGLADQLMDRAKAVTKLRQIAEGNF